LPKADPENQREFYFTEEQAQIVLDDLRGPATSAALKGKGGSRGSLDAYGQAIWALFCGLRAGDARAYAEQLAAMAKAKEAFHREKNAEKDRIPA
jgi:hypothetical protein